MKNEINLTLMLSLIMSLFFAYTNSQNIAYKQEAFADSDSYDYGAFKVVDGEISDDSRWLSNAALDEHWLVIDFKEERKIKTADVYSGYRNSAAIENFVFQIENKGKWIDISGSRITNNKKNQLRIEFKKEISTDKIRFYTHNAGGNGQARIREIKLWAKQKEALEPLTVLTFEKEDPLKHNPKFDMTKHLIFLNQSGFNKDWPKRFTAPLTVNGTFTITPVNSAKVLYTGNIKNNIGDFSDFKKITDSHEFVIRVSGGDLKDGVSVPFSISPFLFEEVTLENAVRHFIDDRGVTGSHPGAFGAAPWRDAPFYAYCTPSLVLFYLANPSFCEQLPVEMNWERDLKRALSPDFHFEPGAGENAMEVVKKMYEELDGPVGENVPDVVQLIHWGMSWWYTKPESKDYAGTDYRLHPETISLFTYFLYGHPWYKQYFTDKFYNTMLNYTFDNWEKYGLLEVDKTIGTFKGRYVPGWTILPNLMMYEIAKREGRADADRYMQAAFNQTKWIIDELDFEDPLVTKGQRMSEHKMMSGLSVFYNNYPEQAPEGLLDKVRQLADIIIRRSNNYWDFRKYDDGENWTLPRKMPGHTGGGSSWNEPGNLAGFPSVAWNINSMLTNSAIDKARKERLDVIAVSQIDNLYGRNPVGYHTALRGVQDFKGVEVGWPIKYNPNVCARLHLVRGTICSTAATEHYPFNPNGAFRHPEGWTAFNAALNVGLAASTKKNTKFTVLKTYKGLEITAESPVLGEGIDITLKTASGERESLTLHSFEHSNTTFQTTIKTKEGAVVANDGIIQLNNNEDIILEYGYGYFKSSATIKTK